MYICTVFPALKTTRFLTFSAPSLDCVYDDPTGDSPNASHFASVAAELCHAGTRVLVAFEIRGEKLKAAFLSAVAQRFTRVRQIPRDLMPELYRVEHIELYELGL